MCEIVAHVASIAALVDCSTRVVATSDVARVVAIVVVVVAVAEAEAVAGVATAEAVAIAQGVHIIAVAVNRSSERRVT